MEENNNNYQVSSTGSWFVTLLIIAIPIVGLVMLFVWSFGNTQDLSKKNWARAQLIWMLIGIAIIIGLSIAGISLFAILN